MPSYEPPKRAVEYVTYVALIAQASGKLFQSSATLAAGDVKVSIDGGAFANLTTLPAVTPAASKLVKVTVSATEMTGDVISVLFSDAAGDEWNDLLLVLHTTARQLDDLAFPTVSGRGLDVSAGGAAGIDWANVESPTTALNLSATNIDVDQVVASVSGAVGSVTGITASDVGAIKAKTDNLPSDPADQSLIMAGIDDLPTNAELATALGTADDAVLAAVATRSSQASVDDLPTNAELATALAAADDAVLAAIAALNNLSAAAVNAEVVDALATDTYAEPGQGAPAATASLAAKVGYVYKFLRNRKTQSATTLSVFSDDAVTVDHKATISDDGVTYTHGEVATGP